MSGGGASGADEREPGVGSATEGTMEEQPALPAADEGDVVRHRQDDLGERLAGLPPPKLIHYAPARARRRRSSSGANLAGALSVAPDLDRLEAWLSGTAREHERPVIPLGFVAAVECGHAAVYSAIELLRERWMDLPVLVTSRSGPRDLLGFDDSKLISTAPHFGRSWDEVSTYVESVHRIRRLQRRVAARLADWHGLTSTQHRVVLALAYSASREHAATVLGMALKTLGGHITEIRSKCGIPGHRKGRLRSRIGTLLLMEAIRDPK